MPAPLRLSTLLFILCFSFPDAQAQAPDSVYASETLTSAADEKPDTRLSNFTRQIGNSAKITSIKVKDFTLENRSVIRYGIMPVALSAAWYGTYTGIDAGLQDETQEARHPVTESAATYIEPLGRSSYMLPAFGGLMTYGLVARNPKARRTAAIGISTLLVNNLVTGKLKSAFNRHRPNSGSDHQTWDGPDGATGENHSFPSSHTSTAFAAATVLATSYKNKPWVPIVAYTGAGLVGMSRIYQNHHWASDVLAGAVIGIASAKVTTAAYNFAESKLRIKKPLVILPQAGPGGFGFTAAMGF